VLPPKLLMLLLCYTNMLALAACTIVRLLVKLEFRAVANHVWSGWIQARADHEASH